MRSLDFPSRARGWDGRMVILFPTKSWFHARWAPDAVIIGGLVITAINGHKKWVTGIITLHCRSYNPNRNTVKAPFIRQWFCLIFKDPDLRPRLRRRKGKKQRRD